MKAHRMLVPLGMALASAVVLAAGVQAAARPDDRGGMLGVGATQVVVAPPDAFERAVLRATEAVPPDAFERAALRLSSSPVRPDDRAGARGPGAGATTFALGTTSGESGFAWSDAALGAASMLGILLLGTVVTLTVRRRRSVILS